MGTNIVACVRFSKPGPPCAYALTWRLSKFAPHAQSCRSKIGKLQDGRLRLDLGELGFGLRGVQEGKVWVSDSE